MINLGNKIETPFTKRYDFNLNLHQICEVFTEIKETFNDMGVISR